MPIGMVQENEDQNNKEAVQINLTTTIPCTTNATLHDKNKQKRRPTEEENQQQQNFHTHQQENKG